MRIRPVTSIQGSLGSLVVSLWSRIGNIINDSAYLSQKKEWVRGQGIRGVRGVLGLPPRFGAPEVETT
jgi:hypothetical protein